MGRQLLLAVGAAAEEYDIGGVEVRHLPGGHAHDLGFESAFARAFGQNGHVAAVAV